MMRIAYEAVKTLWVGKGIDGKFYVGSLSTESSKKFITDWRGKHEVDPKTVKTA